MRTSRTIAGLAGPMLIALTISELLNPRIFDANIAPVTYLSGSLWFLAGLAILRVHNRWSRAWPVVVTLVGWFAVVLGALRMFAPELAAQGASTGPTATVTQAVLLAVGAFLTYRAHGREADRSELARVGELSESWAP
jgi:hypothetical protein